jgi:hypothetical protein
MIGNAETQSFLQMFNTYWNNPEFVVDVKEQILEQMKIIYKENTPEFIYFITLYSVFNDYLDELKKFASTSSHFENNESKENRREYMDDKKGKHPQPKGQNDTLKNILNDLNMDSDKALILSLVLLLTEEKADEMLILALLYILS